MTKIELQVYMDLLPYFQGQVEIQASEDDWFYLGEIREIDIKNHELRINFNWLARSRGGTSRKNPEWQRVAHNVVEVPLPSDVRAWRGPNRRLMLNINLFEYNKAIFYHPDSPCVTLEDIKVN